MKKVFNRDSAFITIFVGTGMEVVGLSLDVFLHVRDEALAAREGVLTASNPGHLLFLSGLALTLVGILMRLAPRRANGRWMVIAIGGTFALTLALWVSGFVSSSSAHSSVHGQPDASGAITYTHGEDNPITWDQLQIIDQMLSEARAATMQYREVQVALADGYQQEGPSRVGEGAHFINREILVAGGFDVTRPTFLLYEHALDWSYELVGVGWLLPKEAGNETPPPYFAPLAAWHYHAYPAPGLCIWQNGTTNLFNEISCVSGGGSFWQESPWMLHAWLFRPSPEGVFSLVNSAVHGIQVKDLSQK